MVIKEIARIVLKTKKGKTFEINDMHIVSLSTSVSCSSGGGIPAGCCNAGTMSLSFKQQGTGLVEADLFQASLTLYVQYPPYAERVRGVYNVTNSNLRYGIFDVSASDNIGLLDDAAYSAKDTENAVCGLLSIIGAGTMRYPAHILAEICNSYGVPHLTQAENAAIIPESTTNLLMTSVSSECSTESIKDFANYLAEYIGGFITAYEDGRVGFGRIGKSEYTETLDEKNIQKGSFQKSPFSVWPTIWKVNFDSGYNNYWYTTSDTPDGYAPLSIEINNNPFWQYLEDSMPSGLVGGKTSDMIKYMWDYIVSIRNYINPFSATVYVPHMFKLGEIVHIKKPGDDSATREFTSCITDVTWTYRGGQQISCAGSDTRLLSCSASRTSAKKAEDYAKTLYRKKTSSGTGTNDTYTKAEIDSKDAAVKAIADKAQSTATNAATAASNAQSTADSAKSTASSAAAAAADAQNVNKTQDGQITELQKTAHTHSNKDILDKIEQPFTTADQTKLNSLENYEHPTYKANSKGFYKFASDGLGHVSETEAVTKSDIVGLGIPGHYYRFGRNEKAEWYQDQNNELLVTKIDGAKETTEGIPIAPSAQMCNGFDSHYAYFMVANERYCISEHTWYDPAGCDVVTYVRINGKHYGPNGYAYNAAIESDIAIVAPKFEGEFFGTNATAEKQGLMSPEDKTKLDEMDLSKYLPLAGGTMSGDIDLYTNKVEVLVGSSPSTSDKSTPVASGQVSSGAGLSAACQSLRSYMGSYRNTASNTDYIFISIREKNGYDSAAAGVVIYTDKTAEEADLLWNRQYTDNTWQGRRTLLDSDNYTRIIETAWAAVSTTGAAETIGNNIKYLKSGNIVFVQGKISFKASLNTPICGTIPSGMRPSQNLIFTGWDTIGEPTAFCIQIKTDGTIQLLSPGTTAGWFKAERIYNVNFCYHIN